MVAVMLSDPLDRMFAALAEPQRRGMVEHLSAGPATVKQLAGVSGMRLPSAVKHLQVLEAGGIVASRKVGRTRTFHLNPEAMRTIGEWARRREGAWRSAFDRLEAAMLDAMEEEGER